MVPVIVTLATLIKFVATVLKKKQAQNSDPVEMILPIIIWEVVDINFTQATQKQVCQPPDRDSLVHSLNVLLT